MNCFLMYLNNSKYPVPSQTMMMTNIASPTGPQMGYYPPIQQYQQQYQQQQPMSYPYYQPTPMGTAVQQQPQQISQQPLDMQQFFTAAPDGGQEISDLPPNKEHRPSSSQSDNIVLPSTSQ